MQSNYITPEIEAIIGARNERIEAYHPIDASEVRRFFQAVMDPSPRYWDEDSAEAAHFGGTVAPLAFPTHAFRIRPDDPDPLASMGQPDFDGLSREFRPGLPSVDVPFPRLLNGGFEYEFFRYTRVGERIFCQSRLKDIYQKESKSGPMVMVLVEDEYSGEAGDVVLSTINTIILR